MEEKTTLEIQRHGSYAAVILPERLDLIMAEQFKQAMTNLVPFSASEKGFDSVILDFSNVKMIDSAGIGKLLMFQKRLKDRGGELKIVNLVDEHIRELFRTIKLNKIIKIEELES